MRIIILEDAEQVAARACQFFTRLIRKKSDAVLGLATGSTPIALYKKLIRSYQANEISFANVTTFNLDEYWGLAPEHPQSYRSFMQQHLFSDINIQAENIHIPLGLGQDPTAICENYENAISAAGGIDLQLLGIGSNGHIGFNEPSSGLCSRTRIKTLTPQTIRDNARFFNADEYQPQLSITMGIGTILESRQVLLLATGLKKADAIKAAIEGPLSASCPASALQMHRNAVFLIDEAAASGLVRADFYRHVEREQEKLQRELGIYD